MPPGYWDGAGADKLLSTAPEAPVRYRTGCAATRVRSPYTRHPIAYSPWWNRSRLRNLSTSTHTSKCAYMLPRCRGSSRAPRAPVPRQLPAARHRRARSPAAEDQRTA